MPPSRPSGFSSTHPSFLQHRYDHNPGAHPLKINLSIPTPLPAWASLPTPPMSGTPPPEPPSDLPQLAGRRRKRDETPPPTTSRQEPSRSNTGSLFRSPLVEQASQRYGNLSRIERMSEQTMLPPPQAMPWEQHSHYGSGGGQGYAVVASSIPPQRPQISPRATRKVKAHVASACINCKKKHLRCDESRPCRRCVQSGKEETCIDVEHKKRGRPPLREPHEGRTVPSSLSLPPLGSSSGRLGPASGLVPILPTPTPSRMPYAAPSYAQPSVAPSLATAQGQFSASQRPASFPSFQSQSGMMPTTQSGSTNPYSFPSTSQVPSGYQHTAYPTPLFPRREAPSQVAAGSMSYYGPPPVQLPPILPAPATANVDPAIAQHQQRQYQSFEAPYGQQPDPRYTSMRPSDSSDERDVKRPKMDMRNILGPRE